MYYHQFGGNGLSKDTEEWSRFGDYIGGVYSGIIAIVAIFITYFLDKGRIRLNFQRNRSEKLMLAILHMKKRANITNEDCTKFQELIGLAKLDLPELLVDKLASLADDYLLYLYQNEHIDADLEDAVLSELKAIYHG